MWWQQRQLKGSLITGAVSIKAEHLLPQRRVELSRVGGQAAAAPDVGQLDWKFQESEPDVIPH